MHYNGCIPFLGRHSPGPGLTEGFNHADQFIGWEGPRAICPVKAPHPVKVSNSNGAHFQYIYMKEDVVSFHEIWKKTRAQK